MIAKPPLPPLYTHVIGSLPRPQAVRDLLVQRQDFTPDRYRGLLDEMVVFAITAINRVVEGVPAEIHLHCCHSVYKRRSDVTGDYKPLLPHLAGLNVDRVNLEFAYQGNRGRK
jgi:methionine synthase II (cobalamin-independent)